MAGMAQKIETKLRSSFDPIVLELQDVSESHRGHAGFEDGGESHWELVIAADGLTSATFAIGFTAACPAFATSEETTRASGGWRLLGR